MAEESILAEISLLWPEGGKPAPGRDISPQWGSRVVADLDLERLVEALSHRPQHKEKVRPLLLSLSQSEDLIAYRQSVLQDILDHPALVNGLEAILPRLSQLGYLVDYPFQTMLDMVVNRLGELETYVECISSLSDLLQSLGPALQSRGFRRLLDALQHLQADERFQSLAASLPELRRKAAGVVSITVGVNLDVQLRPVSATLLSFNERPFTGSGDNFLSRLLGDSIGDVEAAGIAPLHIVPNEIPGLSGRSSRQPDPLMFPLFKDLDRVLKRAMEPVALALKQYAHFHTRPLAALEMEFAFLLSCRRLVERMRAAGVPMCRPHILPVEDRACRMDGLVNINLALRMLEKQDQLAGMLVANDARFDDQARIFILTGPNQGGKTTFTQAVGVAQVLFQAGLYVPAQSAAMSPVDGIFTHFPLEEKPQAEAGRLGEEAQRLHAIFQAATRHSLVLLNESLATTSPGESIYLMRDIVRALRLWGVRAIFVTHLHELAEDIDAFHSGTPGDSRIASLVAGIDEDHPNADGTNPRSYRIIPAPPMGLSYAKDIARRHGISFEQLVQVLKNR